MREVCDRVFHCEVVFTRYSTRYKSVVLSHVVSHVPNKGNGTKCMEYLVRALESCGVITVKILAMPIAGTSGPGATKLRMWYQKFGFKTVKHTMVDQHLFSTEMELNFLPPKLVACKTGQITPETSIGKGLQTTNGKGRK